MLLQLVFYVCLMTTIKMTKWITEVSDFTEKNYADDAIGELKDGIMQTEIKNAMKSSADKVPKFNLKIYAIVYNFLLYFPPTEIRYGTLTQTAFLLMFIV